MFQWVHYEIWEDSSGTTQNWSPVGGKLRKAVGPGTAPNTFVQIISNMVVAVVEGHKIRRLLVPSHKLDL